MPAARPMPCPPDDDPAAVGPPQAKVPLPAPTEADRLAGARALLALMRPEKQAAAWAAVTKQPKPAYRKAQ